jgi:GrpB-like predicted nucleotidyltransferase (UPF0157 family)
MIVIESYRQEWPDEFRALGDELRRALGDLALRIDHIGSTAVAGLAAKDKIDIQITVRALEPPVAAALNTCGFTRLDWITGDHVPPGAPATPAEWTKWVFTPHDADRRPTNVHVRIAGRANGRYALLFRDYLRANPSAAQAYAQVKTALARLHPDDLDAYYAVKDPVCDIIMGAAELWAAATHWQPGPSDY